MKPRRAAKRKLHPSIWAVIIVAGGCAIFLLSVGGIVLLARTGVIP